MKMGMYSLWFLVLCCCVVATAALVFPGCTRLLELDRQIWNPITNTPAEDAAGTPPPLIQIIANALAYVGLAGMALWLRKVKKNSATKADVDEFKNNHPVS